MRDPQYSHDSYKRSGEPRAYSTNMQVSGVSYPSPRFGRTSVSKNYYYEDSSSSSWGFSDPEIKRRKRIALYKAYGIEGKMKASLRAMINCNVYERIFKCFDEDGDGKLSHSELRRYLGTIGDELLMEEAHEVMESMDSNEDGLLGLEEFVRGMERDGEERKMKELREAFRMYKMEGSGCITAKSLKRMLSRLWKSRSVEECSVMIGQFDANGDGVLSFDEFKLMML